MDRKAHWERIYRENAPTEVGWYQDRPNQSLSLISATGIGKESNIIDVGGGASVLVDYLLDNGFKNITVLDISSASIEHAKTRLGDRAPGINWIVADILGFKLPQKFDLWHDRAVFHFLTDAGDRRKYIQAMKEAITSDGHLIISTFSLKGPPKCSGLDVRRYSPESLCREFGSDFQFIESVDESHITPSGITQMFVYCRFRRQPTAPKERKIGFKES